MAGPSIMVRVLGDLSNLSKGFTGAASGAQTAGSRISSAFKSVFATLNKTGVLGPLGETIQSVQEGLEHIAEHGKTAGKVMLGVGSTMVGVGAGLSALGSKEKAATDQLKAAIEATGGSYEDYEKQVEKAVKTQERYGHSAVETKGALQILTQATGDPEKALKLLGTASDLAAAKHESLGTAANQLGKTYNGATRLLKDFGLSAAPKVATATKAVESATRKATAADEAATKARENLAAVQESLAGKANLTTAEQNKLRNAQDKLKAATDKAADAHKQLAFAQNVAKIAAHGQDDTMTALADKLKGQASAAADTFGGKIKAITTTIEDQVSAFGEKYGPALTAAGGAITVFGGIIEAVSSAQEVWNGITAAFGAIEMASLGPILLVVAAVAALIAVVVLIITHFNTVKQIVGEAAGAITSAASAIWDAIKSAFNFVLGLLEKVWSWIKANWPLIAGILLAAFTGPVGVIVALVAKFHKQITDALGKVVDFFRELPGKILGVLGDLGSKLLGWVTGAFSTLGNGLSSAASTVVNFFKQLPGKLLGALGNLGKQLVPDLSGLEEMPQKVGQAISQVVKTISSLPGKLVGALSGLGASIGGAVSHALGSVGDQLSNFGKTLGSAISSGVSGAVHEISSLWSGASQGLQAAYKTITGMWENILGYVRGVPARVAAFLGGLWSAVTGGLTSAYRAVVGAFDSVVGYVRGVPDRVAAVLGGLWRSATATLGEIYGKVSGAFDSVLGFVRGVPGKVGAALAGLWRSATAGLGGIYGKVSGAFDSVLGFLRGLGAKVSAAVAGMWNGIKEAFRGTINGLIDIWNGLHFKLPDINFGPIHLTGPSIGVPRIPHLAQGGLITRTGLVYAHAGEAITPAPRTGPAVAVENVNLYDGLDVEVFLRKAAWVVATERV